MPYKNPEIRKEYHHKYSLEWQKENADRRSVLGKLYYRKNKERLCAAHRRRYLFVRDWLDDYKVKKGCVDCGYKDNPAALEFDHVNGNKPRSGGVTNMSLKAAKLEILKCEVRCSNCHTIRHHDRKGLQDA